jgi:RNA-directed DNA polymerase
LNCSKRSRSSWQILDAVDFESLPSLASSQSDSTSRIERPRTKAPTTIASSGRVRSSFVECGNSADTAGIDKQTIADVERYGVARLLAELAADLKEGRWRPLPSRRVFIPKPGREELRPLSIPAVRDRIVQAAAKIVVEPISEADMLECSFGFRPRRSAHDALQVLVDEAWGGRRWVLESDIANCFEAIPHSQLMSAVEERIVDRQILKLLRAMLRAGVMEDRAVKRSDAGTPQRGVISPCLCNVYLHRLDGSGPSAGTGSWCATRTTWS